MYKSFCFSLICLSTITYSFAQKNWAQDIHNEEKSFYEIQEAFENYWENKIIEKGKEADIFIYRHKLLARALYFTSELGQEISDKLYTAVAIALAYIYKVNKGEDIIEPDIELPNDLIFNEDGTTNEKKSK